MKSSLRKFFPATETALQGSGKKKAGPKGPAFYTLLLVQGRTAQESGPSIALVVEGVVRAKV